MVSVTGVTDKYILQPSLIAKHKASLEWLSATVLWKKELAFFQKLLDTYGMDIDTDEMRKQAGHLQSITTYYHGELIGNISTKLRLHEQKLADMLEHKDETKTEYFKEHDDLMLELEALNFQFARYKEELFSFIEQII